MSFIVALAFVIAFAYDLILMALSPSDHLTLANHHERKR